MGSFVVGFHVNDNPPIKVLEQIPLGRPLNDSIYGFWLPTHGALGKDEKDFSNVRVEVLISDEKAPGAEHTENHTAMIFASGKLGMLVGGLLNMEDQRVPLQRVEIKQAAEATVEDRIEKKRTVWGKTIFYMFFLDYKFCN